MLIAEAHCEVAQLCEQVIEEEAVVQFEQLFKALSAILQLEFLYDQNTQSAYDL